MPDDDYPEHTCPICSKVSVDCDGFGLLACPYCDYCTHPSSTSDRAGNMVCNVCGQVVGRVEARK
jgi:ribosomal protein L37AE/L43A